uniref:hypothetical protein n=1 Tax=uncultured Erythrobacter sp. TaxID=263913 RepID=UPI0026130159|nr:hypothetical protein [uncultured Erythrobacter sp.]
MSKQAHEFLARGEARIVKAPAHIAPDVTAPRNQVESDRNFELPTSLYAATVGLYLAFIGIMFAGFSAPGLIIPMGIFAVFIIAGFGVPAMWTRLKDNHSKPMTMGKFKQAGIMTYTGRLSAKDATIQMLILPVLIVLWACTVAVIAALV